MESRSMITQQIDTPIGSVLAGVFEEGVCLLEFTGSDRTERQQIRVCRALRAGVVKGSHPLLDQLTIELGEYFWGARRSFSLPLMLPGTAFQRSVWEALRAIPYGETRPYLQIAQEIGMPRAARAVGAANGSNPVSILVPCHRLVGSDGNLTGYDGGLWRKERLLEFEKLHTE